MRGSIFQQKGSPNWTITLDLGKDSNGKRQQKWITVKGTRKDAEKRRTQLLHEIDTGSFVIPGKVTVSEYLEQWLAAHVKSTVSARTHQLYSYISTKHVIPTVGNLALCALRPQHIQKMYAAKLQSLSPRTVQLIHVTLGKALNNAVKTGLLAHSPLAAVDCPKVERHEIKTMTEDDITRFLNEARKGEYHALFFTLLFTGVRRGEALSLRWSDIDFANAQLSVSRTMQFIDNKVTFKAPKTAASRRQIALSPSNCAVLRMHRQGQEKTRQALQLPAITESDLVFCHYDGTPWLPNSITHAWIKLVRSCGLTGIRLHDARHSHATLMLKGEVSPKVIQERLGHSTIGITLNLYAHVSPGMQKAAANRFDDMVIKTPELEPS